MKTQTPLSPAKNDFLNFLVRLGKIFSNISIVSLILCLCGVLSFVALAFIFIIAICVIILTLGTIFVIVPNFFDIVTSSATISAEIASFFLENFYIFTSITILCAIISLILLLLDKTNKHTARIVISSIVIAIAVLFIVVALTGVIK